jgi:hypothetical protein
MDRAHYLLTLKENRNVCKFDKAGQSAVRGLLRRLASHCAAAMLY